MFDTTNESCRTQTTWNEGLDHMFKIGGGKIFSCWPLKKSFRSTSILNIGENLPFNYCSIRQPSPVIEDRWMSVLVRILGYRNNLFNVNMKWKFVVFLKCMIQIFLWHFFWPRSFSLKNCYSTFWLNDKRVLSSELSKHLISFSPVPFLKLPVRSNLKFFQNQMYVTIWKVWP